MLCNTSACACIYQNTDGQQKTLRASMSQTSTTLDQSAPGGPLFTLRRGILLVLAVLALSGRTSSPRKTSRMYIPSPAPEPGNWRRR